MVTLADLWEFKDWDENRLPKNQPRELNSTIILKTLFSKETSDED